MYPSVSLWPMGFMKQYPDNKKTKQKQNCGFVGYQSQTGWSWRKSVCRSVRESNEGVLFKTVCLDTCSPRLERLAWTSYRPRPCWTGPSRR